MENKESSTDNPVCGSASSETSQTGLSVLPSFGIVIAGHGSRNKKGVGQFEAMAEDFQSAYPNTPLTYGFLEFSKPTIEEAIEENIKKGAKQIAIVPAILLGAMHLKNDIPSEIQYMQKKYPDIRMKFGAPLQLHPTVLRVCREKIIDAESSANAIVPRKDTCLVIVGRGTTDPDANSQVYKLARLLEEGMGFGASTVCYSGTADPDLKQGLRKAQSLGYKRIITFPFFLFTGILIRRITDAIDDFANSFPELEVLKASYIGTHPLILETLYERATDAINGEVVSDCGLCKYRTQIVGYENEVGQPQQAHHLKVRANADGSTQAPMQLPTWNSNLNPNDSTPTEPENENFEYIPHPIEVDSFKHIEQGRDWSVFPAQNHTILQRLVHTSGDFSVPDDIYISDGAIESAHRAIKDKAVLVTDVTMVQSGFKRQLINALQLVTYSAVHSEEAYHMAKIQNITRSAAGIRLAWQKFGNDVILAIGDAPTAVMEAINLIETQNWRPYLVIGIPVGFIGTEACKTRLKTCLRVPRITNTGTKGGSPWASTILNALIIQYVRENSRKNT